MSRLCEVCRSPDRQAIDTALAAHQESYKAIAARFELVPSSLRRHERSHLLQTYRQNQELQQMLSAENLLQRLAQLDELNLRMLRAEVDAGHAREVALLIRSNVAVVEAYAKLADRAQLAERQAVIDSQPAQLPVPDEPTTREVLKIMIESGMFEQVAHEMEQEKRLEVVEDDEPEDDRAYGV